jgi:asparagine synthase (glutamine-hydrolysing)
MCGILAILEIKSDADALRTKAVQLAKKLRHRGPDWSGIYADDKAVLAHERLAIVDIEHGAQPLIDSRTKRVLAVNGEIYNHVALRAGLEKTHDFQTNSDCEVLLYLYEELGEKMLDNVNGIFAFVLYDPKNGSYVIARDHLGIVPLYWGRDGKGRLYVASEMKAINDVCADLSEFPPGHIYKSSDDSLIRYYSPKWSDTSSLPAEPFSKKQLATGLEDAVRRQLMCDVPYGLLISGGLDSSVIAALAAKYSKARVETDSKDPAWWPQLHSFAVGLKDSPDLKMARKVAEHIKSIHHEIIFTVQEGLDALRDVIYHLETFDITSIRAATPMYLMARKIRAMGIKMILSGEGSDEIFGGYLYFHKAPNAREFYEETVRKLENLHLYDCLRANKAMAAWGVEARVPFLDREFLDLAMGIDPMEKMIKSGRMEKHILREAFTGLIPDEILWRQKEQFSDGVGYGWIDSLKLHAQASVTDEMMEAAEFRFPMKTPLTKEGFYYRSIFDELFPGPSAAACVPDGPSIACSTPTAIRWDAEFAKMADPSGRAVVGVHKDQS